VAPLTLPELRPAPPRLSVTLTNDHRYRLKALAVPGAMWSRERAAYVVDNPSPRAAAAIIALFPELLVEYPQLTEIRDSAYGDARPYDFASELGLRLELEAPLGGKTLYDWQDTDAGYLKEILRRDKGAFVGWDRGLGKTLITAAFIEKLEATRSLVVARNDAKDSVWRAQLEEYLPEHRIIVLPNEAKKREQLLDMLTAEYDRHLRSSGGQPGIRPLVLIVHYEALALIAGARRIEHRDGSVTVTKGGGAGWDRLGLWDLMAFDEGHRLASYNPNSKKNTQMGRALSRLRRRNVDMALNLTGSSIMNRPDDMFGQLHFLFPDIYRAKWADWNDRFIDYVDDGNRKVAIGFKLDRLDDLRRELGVFMVYRTKAEVFKSLPPLIQQDIELEMYPEQRRVYNEVREHFWAKLEEGGIKAANPLSQLNLLRRIATYYPGVPSAKLDFALHELEEESDEQFVVFTWFKEPGRALAEKLGDEVVVVDGDVPIRRRAELLDRHRRGLARILVGSIATLGESLNLQYMHEAIRLDRDWNPQVNAQTTDRLYRHGQESRVTLRDLWAKGTVDTLRVKPNLASKESLRRAIFG
jgi:SNF2 family DNA or RNA helicase